MTMTARWMALPVFVVAVFAVPQMGASAQEPSCQAMQQLDVAALPAFAGPLNPPPPIHDDWAVARGSLNHTPPIHDDWALRPH
jgi:hypothetical protein